MKKESCMQQSGIILPVLVAALAFAFLASCTGVPELVVTDETKTKTAVETGPVVPAGVYASEIAPILEGKCTSCHVPVPSSHAANLERKGACYACHDGDGPGVMPTLRAYPPLTTEGEVAFAVGQGTFTSWIQPGGFMNWDGISGDFDGKAWPENYAIVKTGLTDNETATLTNWARSMQRERKLNYNTDLIASKIDADFALDGTGKNAAWDKATELKVELIPTIYTSVDEISLQALYSDEYLYIRAEYADSTLSMTRGAWLRDTTGNTWSTATKALPDDFPSEDRLAFLWNISIPDYKAVNGCAIKCHANRPGYASFTDAPGTKADIWHSKANRSLPVTSAVINSALTVEASYEVSAGSASFRGFVDDKELEWFQGPRFDTEDAGRHGDSGGSTYGRNRNSAKTGPSYMETNPSDFLDGMVLTQAEIDGGQTIITDPENAAYAGDRAVNTAWAAYQAVKAVVPERILRLPKGSRADVEHAATWTNGVWVNEFKRKLDTGDTENDIIFGDPNRSYEFSIAVFDNCGRGEIPPGHNTYGNGQYLLLRFSH